MTARLLSKAAVEFGERVTLYRIANERGQGTLWHSDPDHAWAVWKRLAPRKGWT